MEKNGEDGKEIHEKINETNKIVDKSYKSYVTRKWLFVIAQWLMVGIVIIGLIYLFSNIEAAKIATNPCNYCMEKFEDVICYNKNFN